MSRRSTLSRSGVFQIAETSALVVVVAGRGVSVGGDVAVKVLLVTGTSPRSVVGRRHLCDGSKEEVNGILVVEGGFRLVIGGDRGLANACRLKGADNDVPVFGTKWMWMAKSGRSRMRDITRSLCERPTVLSNYQIHYIMYHVWYEFIADRT